MFGWLTALFRQTIWCIINSKLQAPDSRLQIPELVINSTRMTGQGSPKVKRMKFLSPPLVLRFLCFLLTLTVVFSLPLERFPTVEFIWANEGRFAKQFVLRTFNDESIVPLNYNDEVCVYVFKNYKVIESIIEVRIEWTDSWKSFPIGPNSFVKHPSPKRPLRTYAFLNISPSHLKQFRRYSRL